MQEKPIRFGTGGWRAVIGSDFIESNIRRTAEGICALMCEEGRTDKPVIIGYDTMGTETTQDDVIIVADPYDTTDHNQDGYGVYAAERFLYNFTFYNFFSEESGELNDYCFLVATPEA